MSLRIKDVAEAAGVSVTTVSRVLSSNGPVSARVRTRVETAIQQLGFRPNAAARRLRSGDSATIGLLVSDIRTPFFTEICRAVEDIAYRKGMRVLLCNTDEDVAKEAMYLGLMEEERITGMIYSPTREAAERFCPEDLPFPVVMIDRAGAASATDAVTLDNRASADRLVEHLIAQGHRSIFGLFGNASTTCRERHAGYCDAIRRRGLELDDVFVAPLADPAQAAVAARLGRNRPDAIIAGNGQLLRGAYRALQEARTHLPVDLALSGFDNEPWTELVEPGITVIAQPVYDIGASAMNLLLERLKGPETPRRTLVLPGQLVVRGSSAGPHATRALPALQPLCL